MIKDLKALGLWASVGNWNVFDSSLKWNGDLEGSKENHHLTSGKITIGRRIRQYWFYLPLVLPFPYIFIGPSFFEVGGPSPIFHFLLHITCILLYNFQSQPTTSTGYGTFIHSFFCSYSMLYTHIWSLGARNCRRERLYDISLMALGASLTWYNLFYVHTVTWSFSFFFAASIIP